MWRALKHVTGKWIVLLLVVGCGGGDSNQVGTVSIAPNQLWSNILASSRATDWTQAGVTGGIPNRTTICPSYSGSPTPLSASSTAAQITAAILACSNDGSTGGSVVPLAAGTFHLTESVYFTGVQNVTLRGQGPDQTTLSFEGSLSTTCSFSGVVCVTDYAWMGGESGCRLPDGIQNLANWTAGYTPGTTQIMLDNITGANGAPFDYNLQAGMLLYLDQLDSADSDFNLYRPFVTENRTYVLNNGCNGQRTGRCVGEVHSVVSITGSGPYTVTVSPPIAYSFWNGNGNNIPQAWWCGRPPGAGDGQGVVYRDGVESLTISNQAANTGYGLINFQGALQSWVKNVRAINSVNALVFVRLSANIEIRDSYFYGCTGLPSNTVSYGIDPLFAGFLKVENNIFQQTCVAMMANPCFVCVYGYNFTIGDKYGLDANNNQFLFNATSIGHVGGTHLILLEGNDSQSLNTDHASAHGTNAMFMTVFRNHYTGTQPGLPPTYPVLNQGYNRFNSYIGNVLGDPAIAGWSYQSVPGSQSRTAIYNIGFGCGTVTANVAGTCGPPSPDDDPKTLTSLMRWGNFDYVTNAVRWCGNSSSPGWSTTCSSSTEIPAGSGNFTQFVPATTTLPASFFLSGRPTWFGSSPWPAIGPDVTGGTDSSGHAANTPAKNCYLKVMHGPPDGTGGPLTFNAGACY